MTGGWVQGGRDNTRTAVPLSETLFIVATVAISFRLWRVHRETTRANVRQTGSVILVRTVFYFPPVYRP